MEFNKLVTIKEKCCRIKKKEKKEMKTHESKTCLVLAYHIATTIVL